MRAAVQGASSSTDDHSFTSNYVDSLIREAEAEVMATCDGDLPGEVVLPGVAGPNEAAQLPGPPTGPPASWHPPLALGAAAGNLKDSSFWDKVSGGAAAAGGTVAEVNTPLTRCNSRAFNTCKWN